MSHSEHSSQLKSCSAVISMEPQAAQSLSLPKIIVKRNGRIAPFNLSRIRRAIELAFRDTRKLHKEGNLPEEIHQMVEHILNQVTRSIAQGSTAGRALTVEEVQDLVELKLMEAGHLDVARDYIIYRNEHKAQRDGSPQQLKISRRSGEAPVSFNPIKIFSKIERLLRRYQNVEGEASAQLMDDIQELSQRVIGSCQMASEEGLTLTTTMVREEIEQQLMASGHFAAAKSYILSEHHKEAGATDSLAGTLAQGRRFRAIDAQGEYWFDEDYVVRKIAHAAEGLEAVNIAEMVEQTISTFYDGMRRDEVDQAFIMAARTKVEWDPEYMKLAARLLLDTLYRDLFQCDATAADIEQKQADYFKSYIDFGISIGRLSPRLKEFDLDRLAHALQIAKDGLFNYMGLQTLFDRYFIHEDERRLETPQIFWMRVAMGVALAEKEDKTERAIEFYNVISSFLYCPATPTLFNSGTTHSQLSSCFLSTIQDDLINIFKVISDDARLSKWAGGIGNDWTPVRATGSLIKGTNGRSQGVIPFMKVANDTAIAVNQGGKRKGAMCAYLETWHLDIEDFLELRKNTGDERRRTHDMNTANWIPDLFFKRVQNGEPWTLFSPNDVPDLHELYGTAFEERYIQYERMADEGAIKLFKRVEAQMLWRKMLSMVFETGHPWMTFKDPSNLRSPQQHDGVVHSSNLCTEILLNTNEHETAVCNLGSLVLPNHISDGQLDADKLSKTIATAMRMLDNVIDVNFYTIPEAEAANQKHRPVGLGIMGFQDALYMLGIPYASHEAVTFSDRCMELVSYHAIMCSSLLAAERGCYQSYQGSLWSRGILPIDSIDLLAQHRSADDLDMDRSSTLPWHHVRESVAKYGMRNSNCMAIAPTATIANITGVIQSIEPTYKNLFVKSNLSGEFTVPNSYLVDELKRRGLWDAEMLDDLKYFDGSLLEIPRIPQDIKDLFLTAFEIEPEWIIECASKRQKWLDQGQSLNLYLAQPNGKRLSAMYLYAWKKGLKTTYYLRTLGATQIEKSTTDINRRGLQPRWMKSRSASANIQVQREAVSCDLGEGCEACQ